MQQQKASLRLLSSISEGNVEEVLKLLDKGVDVEFLDSEGQSPLHVAAKNGHDKIVDILLNKGANADVHDKWGGWTPLHHAVWEGGTGVVKVLLDRGAEKDAQDREGQTPLHLAALRGRIVEMLMLLESGANRDARDQKFFTPLHSAAIFGTADIVQVLLHRGADRTARTKDGSTPLLLAERAKRSDITAVISRCKPVKKASNSTRTTIQESIDEIETVKASQKGMEKACEEITTRRMITTIEELTFQLSEVKSKTALEQKRASDIENKFLAEQRRRMDAEDKRGEEERRRKDEEGKRRLAENRLSDALHAMSEGEQIQTELELQVQREMGKSTLMEGRLLEAERKREIAETLVVEEKKKRSDVESKWKEERDRREKAEGTITEERKRRKEEETRFQSDDRSRKELQRRLTEEEKKREELEAKVKDETERRAKAEAFAREEMRMRKEEEKRRREAEARWMEEDKKRAIAENKAVEESRARAKAQIKSMAEEERRLSAEVKVEEWKKKSEKIQLGMEQLGDELKELGDSKRKMEEEKQKLQELLNERAELHVNVATQLEEKNVLVNELRCRIDELQRKLDAQIVESGFKRFELNTENEAVERNIGDELKRKESERKTEWERRKTVAMKSKIKKMEEEGRISRRSMSVGERKPILVYEQENQLVDVLKEFIGYLKKERENECEMSESQSQGNVESSLTEPKRNVLFECESGVRDFRGIPTEVSKESFRQHLLSMSSAFLHIKLSWMDEKEKSKKLETELDEEKKLRHSAMAEISGLRSQIVREEQLQKWTDESSSIVSSLIKNMGILEERLQENLQKRMELEGCIQELKQKLENKDDEIRVVSCEAELNDDGFSKTMPKDYHSLVEELSMERENRLRIAEECEIQRVKLEDKLMEKAMKLERTEAQLKENMRRVEEAEMKAAAMAQSLEKSTIGASTSSSLTSSLFSRMKARLKVHDVVSAESQEK